MFVTEYVLGFAFDLETKRVALIRKKRPDWQAGKWNGIGGHREGAEQPVEAMVREFEEETGVKTHVVQWRKVGWMRDLGRWNCHVFTMSEKLTDRVKTITDEQVMLHSVSAVRDLPCIENVPALLELCLMRPDHTDARPLFELSYAKHT